MNSFATCFVNTQFFTPRHTTPGNKKDVSRFNGLKTCHLRQKTRLFSTRMSARKEDRPTIEPEIQIEGPDLTLEEIEQILKQFKESDLPHLYYRQGESVIELRRKTNPQGSASSFSLPMNSLPNSQTYNIYIPGPEGSKTNPSVTQTIPEEKSETSTETEEQASIPQASSIATQTEDLNKQQPTPETNISEVAIVSKRVGRFRRGRSKKKPLVEVGDHIKLKQPVCVIEQLGLEHVYFAEVEGVVDKILVQDGDPVEYGQKLMTVSTKV
ncbi:hypothetical protein Gasu2_38920 [Galdieria sulphuraria]|uniref:Acetyl-CoA carboxylase biotin carboxyl carrier protein n=1 Tax=Galdieria sulphuraria TaxID=130081 RepID=M2Y832_GALSU|nr:acetyl-CoA carboxylase biotin carboxyl carrier protein [Galdieria sulphuraria]EME32228.1 acetyl-CoA carboxylase biotin carboxyl carrier protein [Galdieria sulphuraria]GJD09650.1 hypothetical protein Gasu2_38920 [Galdieria sulphuraria]|eukprot:XP_005708748.1 acetyl-CoA carboxylase biotin carboxyl carrier protein [Galdieria sulphuraria]